MPYLRCNRYKVPRSRVIGETSQKNGLRHAIFQPDKYVGDWKFSKKQGYGIMLTRTNRYYNGRWVNNFRDGFGVSCNKVDNVLILEYRGNWYKGYHHGFGEKHFSDHSFYRGFFKHGKREGYGQMWYANGSFYDGDWTDDRRAGLGIYIHKNGNRFEGSWINDMKHGAGRYYHLKTGQLQEGQWIDGTCVYSELIDIPFKQTAPLATPYPLPVIAAAKPNSLMADDILTVLRTSNSAPLLPEQSLTI